MTDVTLLAIVLGLVFVVLLVLLWKSILTLPPHEQGVVVRFGSYRGLINPGFHLVSPMARVVRVDLRSQHLATPPSDFRSPGGTVRFGATLRYRVVDAAKSVFQVNDVPAGLADVVHTAIFDHFGGSLPGSSSPSDFEVTRAVSERLEGAATRFGVKVESVVVERSLAPK